MEIRQFLKSHCLFKKLKNRDMEQLIRFSELLSCSTGSVLQYAGEKSEALYIVVEGQLRDTSGKRFLPGDFTGMESLAGDSVIAGDVFCSVPTRVIKISRHRFKALVSRNSSLLKGIEPVYDEYGRLSSGFPSGYISAFSGRKKNRKKKGKPFILYRGRSSWKYLLIKCLFPVLGELVLLSLRDFITEPLWLIPAVSVVMALLFFIPVIKRVFTVYMITGEFILLKQFRLRGFSLQSRQIPLDQIQGTEVVIKGLLRKIFGIGSLQIKNSAVEGAILFRNMDEPVKVQKKLLQYIEERKSIRNSSEKSEMRKTIENKMDVESGIRPLWGLSDEELGLNAKDSGMPDQVIFRKTPFVLFRKIALPVLLIAGLVTLAVIFRERFSLIPWILSAAVAVPSLFYILWHSLDWSNDLFMVEGGYVYDIDRKPFGKSEERKQIELFSAQNIMTEQKGFLAFLFNYGDVIVVTPGGVSDVKFETVADPVWVQTLLFQLRESWKEQKKSQELTENLDDMIAVSRIMEEVRDRASAVSFDLIAK